MIDRIEIKERGPTPRRLRKVYSTAAKSAWQSTAELFHFDYRGKRFTAAHGKAAGYRPRAGEQLPYGSKAFWKSYYGRKIRYKKTTAPLVWTGRTERATRFSYRISATRNQGVVRYAGARVLNYIPWAAAEFRKILPDEVRALAANYDRELETKFRQDSGQELTTVTPPG